MDPRAITRPRDCALALAVPLRRSEFLRDLEPASPREYAKCYRHSHGGDALTAEALWSNKYERLEARPILQTIDEGRAQGVEVIPNCSLAELAWLMRRKAVVVLAAHWRTGWLQRSDIRDLPAFLRRLRGDEAGVVSALRSHLPPQWRTAIADVDPDDGLSETLMSDLLEAINRVMEAGPLEKAAGPFREAPSLPIYYLSRNRAALNRSCPEAIDDTEGVELEDGTFSAARVAETIGAGFDGLLDLSVCHSVILAEAIKRVNPNCRIMANQEQTPPAVRLRLFREVIRLLAQKAGNYLLVSLTIGENLRAGRRGR
jgi:hypothetical protein